MNLGGPTDPLLPLPPDDADDYTKALHRRLYDLFTEYAKRVDSVIPYSVDTSKVLVPDPTAQGGINWGAGGGGGTTLTTLDEGVTLSASVSALNFVGGGITATGAGGTTTVTVPGGAWGEFLWGSSRDGAIDLDGTNTYPAVLENPANEYYLVRQLHATTIIIRSGIKLIAPYPMYASVSFELEAGATLTVQGWNGATLTQGRPGGQTSNGSVLGTYLGNGGQGGIGGSNNGNGGPAGTIANGVGAIGGVGGTAGAFAGGAANTWTVMPDVSGALDICYCFSPMTMFGRAVQSGTGLFIPFGGGGGGGGGHNIGTGGNTSGGGGGGASIMLLFLKTIIGSGGSILATGGNGGNAVSASAAVGGGGGGGGGCIMCWTTTLNWQSLHTVSVAKGLGGTGAGGGNNGSDGSDGRIVDLFITG